MPTIKNKDIIKILLVDDHELFRTGISSLINSQPDMKIVGEASDGLEAQFMADALSPDLVIMDINMPGMDGLEALEAIIQKNSEQMVIMLTVHDESEQVIRAIKNGAKGYILKNTNSKEFMEMIRTIISNDGALSPELTSILMSEYSKTTTEYIKLDSNSKIQLLTNRERDVLTLISKTKTDKEIASSLSISVYTVKSHVRNILSKLEVQNRRMASDYFLNYQ